MVGLKVYITFTRTCYHLGQVPQHVPAPQVQNLGAAIPNMQAGLVPPPTSVSAQPPVEEVQQQQPQQQPQQQQQPPLQSSPQQQHDDGVNDVHGDSGYTEEQQEIEPEIPEQPQEPGKVLIANRCYRVYEKVSSQLGFEPRTCAFSYIV